MLRTVLLAVSLILASPIALSQSNKISVEVKHSGDDSVGKNFVFELKDALRGSNTFRLVDPKDPGARIRVTVVSLNAERDVTAAIAVTLAVDAETIPVNGLYITTLALHTGRNRARDQAREILPDLDSAVSFLQSKWPAVYKMLVPSAQ